MGVSGFGFGGLPIALVFDISTGIGAPSSLLSEKIFALGGVGAYPGIGLMWTWSLEYCVPIASSSTVWDRCPSTETIVPLDHRAFFNNNNNNNNNSNNYNNKNLLNYLAVTYWINEL